MTSLGYLNIPSSATRLLSSSSEVQPVPKIQSSLPSPSDEPASSEPTPPSSPLYNLLPNALLSSALPSGPQSNPRAKKNLNVPLLSSKEPLSIAVTTKNFKAFVEHVGPVFWLQDRIEEIVLWKKSWKWTVLWMSFYCLLCYYPRLLLCLPQVTIIVIIVSKSAATDEGTAKEGSVDWQANIQAIQNLMGLYVEAYAMAQPYIRFIDNDSHSKLILTLLVLTLLPVAFIASMPSLPVRQITMTVGISSLAMTHPNVRPLLPRIVKFLRSPEFVSHVKTAFRRVMNNQVFSWILPHHPSWTSISPKTWASLVQLLSDNNNLSDAAWNSEMREVELFENERLDPAQVSQTSDETGHDRKKSYSKAHLRPGERSAFSRRRDGWGPVSSVSTSTFSLAENWYFVETEDWRADLEASWSSSGGDSNGWVYTNDSWLDARSNPYHDHGVATTRPRRWVRRVWYNPR